MKRLFAGLALALCAVFAGATTLTPVQLLNPAGSTAGKAIISTGASTAPTWGTVGVGGGGTGVSSFGAYSVVVGNGTGALNWVNPGASGTIFASTGGSSYPSYQTAAALGLAPLASPAFTGSPTFAGDPVRGGAAGTSRGIQFFTGSNLRWYQFVDNVAEGGSNAGSNWNLSRYSDAGSFLDTPFSILRSSGAVSIKGSQTNDAAAAGFVGEYVSNSASGVSLTSGTIANISSISLTAGDWDVQGEVDFVPAGTTVMTLQFASVNTSPTVNGPMGQRSSINGSQTAGSGSNIATPTWRVSLNATTTIYVNALGNFTTSTATANGFIRARRVR